MARAKQIHVKESVSHLKGLLFHSSVTLSNRIRMLILIKTHEGENYSKRQLGYMLCVSSSSVQIWRNLYQTGGLSLLLEDKRIGFKPTLLSQEEHDQIKEKLHDPSNGLRGYVELQDWIANKFGKDLKYNTLLKYCGRNFGSKSKVARKSHARKDVQAVETFKKTSVQSVNTSTQQTKENTKE
jgi:transposase